VRQRLDPGLVILVVLGEEDVLLVGGVGQLEEEALVPKDAPALLLLPRRLDPVARKLPRVAIQRTAL
jgi:hypothetical protein